MDVVLVVDDAGARLELDEPRAPWCASADPATRLLALWGRRSPTRAVRWSGDDPTSAALDSFLWGAGETTLSETR